MTDGYNPCKDCPIKDTCPHDGTCRNDDYWC